MDILAQIKRLVLWGRIVFTVKAQEEMYLDQLTDDDVIEAIMNAPSIFKTLRSTSSRRQKSRERLYVIVGMTYDGVVVYTKGTVRRQDGKDAFYVLISAKQATVE